MDGFVRYEQAAGIATITMDDGKVNVMSPGMLKALHTAFDQAERDQAVTILTGRPGIFSAGFDLNVFAKGTAEAMHEMLMLGSTLALRVLSFPLPVVAACTGHAYPMGAFLMLGADLRIGAGGPFRIGLNEVAIRLTVPHFALEMARQRLTPAYFNRVVTGELLGPEEAAIAGYLDRVVAPEALMPASREAAEALTKIDFAAHAGTKARLRAGSVEAVRAAIAKEITLETYQARVAKRAAA